jgi:predicted amidohydrolase
MARYGVHLRRLWLRAAWCRLDTVIVGSQFGSQRAARAAVAEAAAAGARLVVPPELSASGYVFCGAGEAWSLASPAVSGVTLREWRSLAARHDLAIAGGFCELGCTRSPYLGDR